MARFTKPICALFALLVMLPVGALADLPPLESPSLIKNCQVTTTDTSSVSLSCTVAAYDASTANRAAIITPKVAVKPSGPVPVLPTWNTTSGKQVSVQLGAVDAGQTVVFSNLPTLNAPVLLYGFDTYLQNESTYVMSAPFEWTNLYYQAPDLNRPVYRFWSPAFNNAHFFTINTAERDHIIASDSNWVYEGVAFTAKLPQYAEGVEGLCGTSGVPVDRFYSPRFASHFYTASLTESAYLRANDTNWRYEGLAYCAESQGSLGSVPLYRFWSSRFNKHFYTASEAEKAHLIAGDPNWRYEGVAYYIQP